MRGASAATGVVRRAHRRRAPAVVLGDLRAWASVRGRRARELVVGPLYARAAKSTGGRTAGTGWSSSRHLHSTRPTACSRSTCSGPRATSPAPAAEARVVANFEERRRLRRLVRRVTGRACVAAVAAAEEGVEEDDHLEEMPPRSTPDRDESDVGRFEVDGPLIAAKARQTDVVSSYSDLEASVEAHVGALSFRSAVVVVEREQLRLEGDVEHAHTPRQRRPPLRRRRRRVLRLGGAAFGGSSPGGSFSRSMRQPARASGRRRASAARGGDVALVIPPPAHRQPPEEWVVRRRTPALESRRALHRRRRYQPLARAAAAAAAAFALALQTLNGEVVVSSDQTTSQAPQIVIGLRSESVDANSSRAVADVTPSPAPPPLCGRRWVSLGRKNQLARKSGVPASQGPSPARARSIVSILATQHGPSASAASFPGFTCTQSPTTYVRPRSVNEPAARRDDEPLDESSSSSTSGSDESSPGSAAAAARPPPPPGGRWPSAGGLGGRDVARAREARASESAGARRCSPGGGRRAAEGAQRKPDATAAGGAAGSVGASTAEAATTKVPPPPHRPLPPPASAVAAASARAVAFARRPVRSPAAPLLAAAAWRHSCPVAQRRRRRGGGGVVGASSRAALARHESALGSSCGATWARARRDGGASCVCDQLR